jgi:16S rRNA (cytidine1402-2'-O)-methyltransferase
MLYICATPIGNLDDISLRALEILAKADIILCEDTRNSQKLLNHHGINQKRLIALHDHNENEVSQKVLEWLNQELLIVQISDAGTPGISDPGARLCNVLHANQITPHPLPGACAYISLLSVSGIVDTPSLFHGFLPNKSSQRQKQLNTWLSVEYAVAIYESPHRILDSLSDLVQCLGEAREIVMGREMTKHFETIKKLSAGELLEFVKSDSNQQRGEFVLIILPPLKIRNTEEQLTAEQISALNIIAAELPSKKAVNLTNKLFGGNKDLLYQYLLDLKAD